MKKLYLSLVQMCSGPYKMTNLTKAEELIRKAVLNKPVSDISHLICLPEVFNFRSTSPEEGFLAAEEIPGGYTFKWAEALARELGIYILGGSILEKEPSSQSDKPFNTAFVVSPKGELITKYRKINLFKLQLENAPELCEPKYREAGSEIVSFEIDGIKIGLAICFDLRFPKIFTELRKTGCELMLLPSAFTYKTGQAHWETLCKARAIETQSFFAAPNQSLEANCWGHSLIINPWGELIATLEEENEGFISAELDFMEVQKIRERIPLNFC